MGPFTLKSTEYDVRHLRWHFNVWVNISLTRKLITLLHYLMLISELISA